MGSLCDVPRSRRPLACRALALLAALSARVWCGGEVQLVHGYGEELGPPAQAAVREGLPSVPRRGGAASSPSDKRAATALLLDRAGDATPMAAALAAVLLAAGCCCCCCAVLRRRAPRPRTRRQRSVPKVLVRCAAALVLFAGLLDVVSHASVARGARTAGEELAALRARPWAGGHANATSLGFAPNVSRLCFEAAVRQVDGSAVSGATCLESADERGSRLAGFVTLVPCLLALVLALLVAFEETWRLLAAAVAAGAYSAAMWSTVPALWKETARLSSSCNGGRSAIMQLCASSAGLDDACAEARATGNVFAALDAAVCHDYVAGLAVLCCSGVASAAALSLGAAFASGGACIFYDDQRWEKQVVAALAEPRASRTELEVIAP